MPGSKTPTASATHLWVTQGKTEHMATLVDPSVLSALDQHKRENPSGFSLAQVSILDLVPFGHTGVAVCWNSTGQNDTVEASTIRFRDMESEGRGSRRRASRRSSSATSNENNKNSSNNSKRKRSKTPRRQTKRSQARAPTDKMEEGESPNPSATDKLVEKANPDSSTVSMDGSDEKPSTPSTGKEATSTNKMEEEESPNASTTPKDKNNENPNPKSSKVSMEEGDEKSLEKETTPTNKMGNEKSPDASATPTDKNDDEPEPQPNSTTVTMEESDEKSLGLSSSGKETTSSNEGNRDQDLPTKPSPVPTDEGVVENSNPSSSAVLMDRCTAPKDEIVEKPNLNSSLVSTDQSTVPKEKSIETSNPDSMDQGDAPKDKTVDNSNSNSPVVSMDQSDIPKDKSVANSSNPDSPTVSADQGDEKLTKLPPGKETAAKERKGDQDLSTKPAKASSVVVSPESNNAPSKLLFRNPKQKSDNEKQHETKKTNPHPPRMVPRTIPETKSSPYPTPRTNMADLPGPLLATLRQRFESAEERIKREVLQHRSEFPAKIRAAIQSAESEEAEAFCRRMHDLLESMLLWQSEEPWGGFDISTDTLEEFETAIRMFPDVLHMEPDANPYDLTGSAKTIPFIPVLVEVGKQVLVRYRSRGNGMFDRLLRNSIEYLVQDMAVEVDSLDDNLLREIHEQSIAALVRLKDMDLQFEDDIYHLARKTLVHNFGKWPWNVERYRVLINWNPVILEGTNRDGSLFYEFLVNTEFLCADDLSETNLNKKWRMIETIILDTVGMLFEAGMVYYPKNMGFLFDTKDIENGTAIESWCTLIERACEFCGRDKIFAMVDNVISNHVLKNPDVFREAVVGAATDDSILLDALYLLTRGNPSQFCALVAPA